MEMISSVKVKAVAKLHNLWIIKKIDKIYKDKSEKKSKTISANPPLSHSTFMKLYRTNTEPDTNCICLELYVENTSDSDNTNSNSDNELNSQSSISICDKDENKVITKCRRIH